MRTVRKEGEVRRGRDGGGRGEKEEEGKRKRVRVGQRDREAYLSLTGCGSSSTPGFCRSSSVASGFSFQRSSNLLICGAVI